MGGPPVYSFALLFPTGGGSSASLPCLSCAAMSLVLPHNPFHDALDGGLDGPSEFVLSVGEGCLRGTILLIRWLAIVGGGFGGHRGVDSPLLYLSKAAARCRVLTGIDEWLCFFEVITPARLPFFG